MVNVLQERPASAGDARIDALAREREAAYPPVLRPRPCDGCGGATGPKDFALCSWAYYFSKLRPLSVAASLTGKVMTFTRVVRHATYHWFCPGCAKKVRAARTKAGAIRFVGLFIAGIGLIGTMVVLAALFLLPLSPRDRATVQGWAWAPPAALALGIVLCLLARRAGLPRPLDALDVRPFSLYLFAQIDPANLDTLRRDSPDLFGMAPPPGRS